MARGKRGRQLTGYVPDHVVFDLETTGLSPLEDQIIEISAVKVEKGEVRGTFSTLVDPGRPIPAAATRVNGITDQMVAGAPTVERAMEQFLAFIGTSVLVGHNIHSFDMRFLYQAISVGMGRELSNDYIDTLPMARCCLPQLRRHRLTDLAAHFHISTEGAHRALNDCMMNEKCYAKMGKQMAEAGERAGSGGYAGMGARAGSGGYAGMGARTGGETGAAAEAAATAVGAVRSSGSAGRCPRCGGELVKRNGRYGPFLGCGNFPSCRYTQNLSLVKGPNGHDGMPGGDKNVRDL